MVMLLFWKGVSNAHALTAAGWSYAAITSYYVFLTVFGSLTSSNIEDDIARKDILKGNLAAYILRPVSYFWIKFLEELPYRVVKAFYGLIIFLILYVLLGRSIFVFHTVGIDSFLFCIMILLAIFLGYIMKVVLAFLAFWVTDIRSALETFDVANILLAGYLVPLFLAPGWLSNIAYVLPFSYVVYFPIASFEGKLTFAQSINVIIMQLIWLGIFYVLYLFMWKRGVKKFSGI